ncbi:MAG: hypothetical protein Q9160_002446 [Pyrenula sp. 1 TL-2023]
MATSMLDRPVKPHIGNFEDSDTFPDGDSASTSDADSAGSQELSVSSANEALGGDSEVTLWFPIRVDRQLRDDRQSIVSSLDHEEFQPALNDISFGALAQAQESFSLGKRKRETQDEARPGLDALRTQLRESTRKASSSTTKSSQPPPSQRSSKHAPTVQSSKRPVTRTLTVFEPSAAQKSRDPRFDPAVMSSTGSSTYNATEKANKNYSFLAQYRDAEIRTLNTQIKKTRDPDLIAELKRQVMSMESKKRATEAKTLERSIRQQHRKKEKELIREGKKQKPYFLKDSEVRKEVEEERQKGMGSKQREKSEKRKRKKAAGKEIKAMPNNRRVYAETPS